MHAPDMFWWPQRELGMAAVRTQTFEPKLKESIVLRVAYMSNSDYELHHHKALAENAGVTEAMFEALRVGDFSSFTPRERAVLEFVTEVVRDVSPREETIAAVREYLPNEQLFELIFFIGSYMMTARVAAVSGLELDEEPVRAWR